MVELYKVHLEYIFAAEIYLLFPYLYSDSFEAFILHLADPSLLILTLLFFSSEFLKIMDLHALN
jgi:hypothetical protein